jgi:ubiquinone/menaquinone biosynthesis C-methylase UbiE
MNAAHRERGRGEEPRVVRIHASARGFEAAAADYDRARPEYPDAVARWLVERLGLRPGRRVVDIAAGTGKLTRLLSVKGVDVVAVEPVAGMRVRLASALPGVQLLDGVAEDIPLADGSVDAAAVGQAFHWFDGERALSEIHRIVRDDGRLAVVYNRRDLEDPIHAGIEAIISPLRGETPAHRIGRWRAAFDRTCLWKLVDELELAHVQHLDHEGVVRRVASTSFIAGLPEHRRAGVLDQVRELVKGRPEPIGLPHICECFLWARVPPAA